MACFRRYCEKITSAAIMGRPSCSRIGTDMGHMLCFAVQWPDVTSQVGACGRFAFHLQLMGCMSCINSHVKLSTFGPCVVTRQVDRF